jgi:hypothetical protein
LTWYCLCDVGVLASAMHFVSLATMALRHKPTIMLQLCTSTSHNIHPLLVKFLNNVLSTLILFPKHPRPSQLGSDSKPGQHRPPPPSQGGTNQSCPLPQSSGQKNLPETFPQSSRRVCPTRRSSISSSWCRSSPRDGVGSWPGVLLVV